MWVLDEPKVQVSILNTRSTGQEEKTIKWEMDAPGIVCSIHSWLRVGKFIVNNCLLIRTFSASKKKKAVIFSHLNILIHYKPYRFSLQLS